MTDEQIIEMAKQVGIKRRTDKFFSEYCDGIYDDDLKAFAKLVAQHERKVCAQLAVDAIAFNGGTVQMESHVRQAIEARGEA